jgi:hypothetical protein
MVTNVRDASSEQATRASVVAAIRTLFAENEVSLITSYASGI